MMRRWMLRILKTAATVHAAVYILAAVLVVALVWGVAGYGVCQSYLKKHADKKIEKLLADKYGKEFLVRSVEKTGGSDYEPVRYHAVVSLAGGTETFDAYADRRLKSVSDCYAKLLFDEAILEAVEQLLRQAQGLGGYSCQVFYSSEERAWSEEDTWEEYFAESVLSYVIINLETIDAETEVVAERVYHLAELLKADDIPFQIWYDNQGQKVYLSDFANGELQSFDDYLQNYTQNGN